MNSFLLQSELLELGLPHLGSNVLISRKASIYGVDKISIGDNVRIDDFCILSGNITIRNYIHIAAYSALYGGDCGIEIDSFANISSRVCIYAITDDFSGETMTNPMVPDNYKKVHMHKVRIGRHVIIGTGSTVLPGVCIGEGCAVGAMSLVKNDLLPWGIYAGIPVVHIKDRSRNLLKLESDLFDSRRK